MQDSHGPGNLVYKTHCLTFPSSSSSSVSMLAAALLLFFTVVFSAELMRRRLGDWYWHELIVACRRLLADGWKSAKDVSWDVAGPGSKEMVGWLLSGISWWGWLTSVFRTSDTSLTPGNMCDCCMAIISSPTSCWSSS